MFVHTYTLERCRCHRVLVRWHTCTWRWWSALDSRCSWSLRLSSSCCHLRPFHLGIQVCCIPFWRCSRSWSSSPWGLLGLSAQSRFSLNNMKKQHKWCRGEVHAKVTLQQRSHDIFIFILTRAELLRCVGVWLALHNSVDLNRKKSFL